MNATGRVILLGASSQVGVYLIPRLRHAGIETWAVSRQPAPVWFSAMNGSEWLSPDTLYSRLQEAPRCVLSAGPLEMARPLAEAIDRESGGVATIVALSSASVLSKQSSPVAAERDAIRALARTEQALLDYCRGTGIALTLLRPTMIYGCGLDQSLSRLARFARRFGFLPIARGARGLRQPVHADDLAEIMIATAATHQTAPQVVTVGGASRVEYSDLLKQVLTAVGKHPRLVSLPKWVLKLAIRCLRRSKPTELNVAMVERQYEDLIGGDLPVRPVGGIQPRKFILNSESFAPPGADWMQERLDALDQATQNSG